MNIAVAVSLPLDCPSLLSVGESMARSLGGELFLIHQLVTPTWSSGPSASESGGVTDHLYDFSRRELERLIDEREHCRSSRTLGLAEYDSPEGEEEDLVVHPVVLRSEDGKSFGDSLRSMGVDLLILGLHPTLDRHRLGSFTELALPFCHCPVLLYPIGCGEGEARAFPPRRVLVADDYGSCGSAGFRLAHDWALKFGASAVLLCATEGLQDEDGWHGPYEVTGPVTSTGAVSLDDVLRGSSRDIETYFASSEGYPLPELVRNAGDFSADLVIVRGHGETYLDRNWLGDVAPDLVTAADCPVLILRGPSISAALSRSELRA
ncbi:MAG: universal stress protein [Planctomycetota bacterium]